MSGGRFALSINVSGGIGRAIRFKLYLFCRTGARAVVTSVVGDVDGCLPRRFFAYDDVVATAAAENINDDAFLAEL